MWQPFNIFKEIHSLKRKQDIIFFRTITVQLFKRHELRCQSPELAVASHSTRSLHDGGGTRHRYFG